MHVGDIVFVRMQQAESVMHESPRFLDEAASAAVQKFLGDALELYAGLAVSAAEIGAQRWRIVPKHHAWAHIAYDNGGINPRKVHCYLDEDMVGKLKKIYVRCHAASAGRRGLQRYRLLLGVLWKQLREERGYRLRPRGGVQHLVRKRSLRRLLE